MKNKFFEQIQSAFFSCKRDITIRKDDATFLVFDGIVMIFLLQQVVLMIVYLCYKGQPDRFWFRDFSGLSIVRYEMLWISAFLIDMILKISVKDRVQCSILWFSFQGKRLSLVRNSSPIPAGWWYLSLVVWCRLIPNLMEEHPFAMKILLGSEQESSFPTMVRTPLDLFSSSR